MTFQEKLELIWNNAKPCNCGNDDNWGQDVTGSIYCNKCEKVVVE